MWEEEAELRPRGGRVKRLVGRDPGCVCTISQSFTRRVKSDANPHLKNDDKFGEWLTVGGARQNLHFVALSKTKEGGKKDWKSVLLAFFFPPVIIYWQSKTRREAEQRLFRGSCLTVHFLVSFSFLFYWNTSLKEGDAEVVVGCRNDSQDGRVQNGGRTGVWNSSKPKPVKSVVSFCRCRSSKCDE